MLSLSCLVYALPSLVFSCLVFVMCLALSCFFMSCLVVSYPVWFWIVLHPCLLITAYLGLRLELSLAKRDRDKDRVKGMKRVAIKG